MNEEATRKEIDEAIFAGERALLTLEQARDQLAGARNWGIVDLLGGGLFTDMIKHSKMNRASALMEEARRDLQAFQRELRDVRVPDSFRLDVGGFLSFADFFFDGLVADYLVQSRIADSRRQVDEAIRRVSGLLEDLERMRP